MKVKTNKLSGAELDWAVASVEGVARATECGLYTEYINPQVTGAKPVLLPFPRCYSPSTRWAQGGPIIEREGIQINFMRFDSPPYWTAHAEDSINKMRVGAWAPTPLIAAMRCYVASKLGDEVDVPDGLLK